MIIPESEVTTDEVKSWRGLHLLHFQSSACSQKVRILMREKDIAFESHPVNLGTHQHVSRWFLGINPRGVVPVLVHDGVVHVESNDILEYLDSRIESSAPSFFPQSEEERAWVAENLELENSLHMDLRNLTMGFIMPRRAVTKSERTLERWEREGADNPKRVQEVKWWRDFATQGIPAETARASVEAHRRVFDTLDARLARSEWLIGGRISVLEIAWFITTTRLASAGYPLERHARLARWHARLEARASFREETRDAFPIRAFVVPAYRAFRKARGSSLLDVTGSVFA